MAVVDYESSTAIRRRPLTWLLAPVAGAFGGVAVAQITFEPMLRVLANGQQYQVFDLAESFRAQVRFTIAMALSGVLIGVSIAAASRLLRLRPVVHWAVSFGAVFCSAALLGLVYARNQQQSVVGLGLPLASAPILIAPAIGCAAVILALGALSFRRGIGRAESGTGYKYR